MFSILLTAGGIGGLSGDPSDLHLQLLTALSNPLPLKNVPIVEYGNIQGMAMSSLGYIGL